MMMTLLCFMALEQVNGESNNGLRPVSLVFDRPSSDFRGRTQFNFDSAFGPSNSFSSKNYDEYVKNVDFVTRNSRTSFIRKVYSVFMTQMITTIGVTAAITTNEDLKYFLHMNYKFVSITATVLSIIAVMSLVSHPTLRYKRPQNLAVLGVHTLCQSILLGVFCTFFHPRVLCLGTLHSLTAFTALTAYSFQNNPKYDLSIIGNLVLTASSCMVMGTLLGKFFDMRLWDNVTSATSAVLMAVYMAYDTQRVVNGKGKYAYGQREYILAALNLYQDLYGLFTRLVLLLSKLEQTYGQAKGGTDLSPHTPYLRGSHRGITCIDCRIGLPIRKQNYNALLF